MAKSSLLLAASLSVASCTLPFRMPARSETVLEADLRSPNRQAVAEVLHSHGNIVEADDSRGVYYVVNTNIQQVGGRWVCTLSPTDLVSVQGIRRHIRQLNNIIAQAVVLNGDETPLGSACWCLSLMRNLRSTLESGHATFNLDGGQVCDHVSQTNFSQADGGIAADATN